jgi:hypothetical protein
MAVSPADILRDVAAKRVRVPRVGAVLQEWRGAHDIEEVIRKVKDIGVDLDGSTLRGWEYGWTGAPDPMRLLALAHVYRKTAGDVLSLLALARKIDLQKDLMRHASATTSG